MMVVDPVKHQALPREDRLRPRQENALAWDAIVLGRGTVCSMEAAEAIAPLYSHGTTDEFLPPLIFPPPTAEGQRVHDGDVVFFFNFRSDRARQLSAAFLEKDFSGFDREVWPRVHYVTLTQYDAHYD